MEILKYIENNRYVHRGIISLVVLILIMGVWALLRKMFRKYVQAKDFDDNILHFLHTLGILANTLVTFVSVVVILQINGINVNSLIAGLGVSSIIVGFAIQDMLKDWVMGMGIISSKYYMVGDYVKIGETIGKVEQLTLKTTRVEDIYTGNTVIISNREILRIEKMSNRMTVTIPISYELSSEKRKEVLKAMVSEIEKCAGVQSCQAIGIQEFASSALVEMLRVEFDDFGKSLQIRRNIQTTIFEVCEKQGISMPYERVEVEMVSSETSTK